MRPTSPGPPAREAGWVAVVEGYTDVIAAHQVGLCNVVGTLGTALGDDHVARPPAAGRPRRPGLRRRRGRPERRPTARSSSSWATRWTSAC